MKIEYSEEQNKNKRIRKKRKKRRSKIGFFIGFVALVIGALATLSLTIFFNVNVFAISGESIYTESDIITASGLRQGDNLLRLSVRKAEKEIETLLPYVKKATVTRKFPEKIRINVTPATEYAVIETDNGFAVVDADFKVLKIEQKNREDLLSIKGIEFENFFVGETIVFSNSEQKEKLKELTTLLTDNFINATYIDIESLLSINFKVDNKHVINLGNYSNMGRKIALLVETLPQVDNSLNAKIDLSTWTESNKKAILTYDNPVS